MKNFTLLLAFIPLFSFAQMTEKEIEKKLKNSYFKHFDTKTNIKKLAKSYYCVQNNYNIDLSKENDLLSKEDFFIKNPDYTFNDRNSTEYTTIYKGLYLNNKNNINEVFEKCYNKNLQINY